MTAITLAGPDDLDRLEPLCAAFHEEMGYGTDEAHRRAALAPLLDGSPLGAVYLLGPPRAPVGYIVLTFAWSVELGGLDGFVDEIFMRDKVRGRGLGAEVLSALMRELARSGLRSLHLETEATSRVARLYTRLGFRDTGMALLRADLTRLART